MLPLNYAILKYFTTVERACADDVIAALAPEYGHFKALRKPEVIEALMTAEKNALLEEVGYDLDEEGALRVFSCDNARESRDHQTLHRLNITGGTTCRDLHLHVRILTHMARR